MANPRRSKSKGNTATAEEPTEATEATTSEEDTSTMSDTEVTEAPEAETQAPEATPEAPAEPKVERNYEAELFDGIVAFAAERNVEALQEIYRSVPAAARGKHQSVAMKRAMTEGHADMDVLGDVLDAFNNLPAVTKTRTSKPAMDEATAATLRLASIFVAYETLRQQVGDEAHAAAQAWYANGAPEEHRDLVLKVASNVVSASEKLGRGGGSRSSFKETLVDLVNDGRLPVGSVLTGPGDASATVLDGGKLESKGETYDNPTAACKVWRTKEDGSSTSTNGWDFWTLDGKSIGDLRSN